MVQNIFVSDGIAFALAFIQTKDLSSHGGGGKQGGWYEHSFIGNTDHRGAGFWCLDSGPV